MLLQIHTGWSNDLICRKGWERGEFPNLKGAKTMMCNDFTHLKAVVP